MFLFNLFGFLFTSFHDELLYFLKWVGIPIIGLIVNLLSIYTLRTMRHREDFDGSQIETFFLFSLNIYLGLNFIASGFDFSGTLQRISEFRFTNLIVPYFS